MASLAHYDLLAELFEYPQADYPKHVRRALDALEGNYPEAAAHIRNLANALPESDGTFDEQSLDEVQEIFTRSFDVQSITTLGLGYVCFGDDYKRGELLVNLNREHRTAGVDCGTELSDHLPTVLRLIPRWDDAETKQEFADQIMHPALVKMIGEFGTERMEQRNKLYKKHYKTLIRSCAERGLIFREPLSALLIVVMKDFSLSKLVETEKRSTFLASIGREMDIEAKGSRQKRFKNRQTTAPPRALPQALTTRSTP